jgi:DNA helicase II / ATP-dependent DNA helicase PcrA
MTLAAKAQVILGPPGTGKTSTLLGLLEEELELGTEPERIGFFTFTKQAVKEGKTRALERFEISQKQLPYFRTLHSLCFLQLGLSKDSVLGAQDFRDLNDKLNLRLTGSVNTDDGNILSVSKDDRLLFIENLARMRQVPLEQQWQEVDDVVGWFELERFARGLNLFKRDRVLLDYTDMLEMFLKRGRAPQLDVMFVDEAQDLSPLQWAVVRKLCDHADKIYIAGDDDQAIYRWAGADVEYLISNSKNAIVLKQSYRIPKSIHHLAERCIGQVASRVRKKWEPRKEAGQVRWEASYESIDMSEGDWLVLARTNYLLEGVENYCRSEGWFFKNKNRASISEKKVKSVKDWETIRSGGRILVTELINLLSYMKVRVPNSLSNLDFDSFVTLEEAKNHIPKIPTEHWYDVFDGMSVRERSYIRAMLRRGEKITKEPRIRLSTIHAAKGGEATNVILMTDLSTRVYNSYQKNPDDESRVFYVGLTRAKENLYLIEPRSTKYFPI